MTEQQNRFVREYLKDFNGAAAARRAGYPPEDARHTASCLLRTREVKEALTSRFRLEGGEDRVLRELEAVAFSQGSDANGAQVKMASKLKALELLGKHMGLFEGVARDRAAPVTILEDIPQAVPDAGTVHQEKAPLEGSWHGVSRD